MVQSPAQQIQDAHGRHIEKKIYRDISVTVWPIVAKFGKITQIGPLRPTDGYKFEYLKIQDVRHHNFKY